MDAFADAFSARRMLLERILGEPDFAHYQSERRHELVPVKQIKLVQEDPLAGTPVLIRWYFNNYTLVYGSLSQEQHEKGLLVCTCGALLLWPSEWCGPEAIRRRRGRRDPAPGYDPQWFATLTLAEEIWRTLQALPA
ncbi:unnamed protein product [Durusdinium trenchii]|uniref:Uncharacterized protein n=1 Tax=Durusdinium trenchii TaxID=1381693 RepID=A0ABP0LZL1_9DINO